MNYEKPAIESRQSVEGELLQFLNGKGGGGQGSMS
jgi:hypothetical protein